MNLERRIARLNKVLADKFGSSNGPDGRIQRFKWMHTGEVHMIVDNGPVTTSGGLVLPGRQDYQAVPFAARLGSCWCIFQWTAPNMTEWQWRMTFGTQFAYPAHGRYLPIDNARMAPGDEPDESINEFIIGRIQAQLDARTIDHLDACIRDANRDIAAKQQEFADRVDDWWPAFDNEPGKRGEGATSFGGLGESRIFGGNNNRENSKILLTR